LFFDWYQQDWHLHFHNIANVDGDWLDWLQAFPKKIVSNSVKFYPTRSYGLEPSAFTKYTTMLSSPWKRSWFALHASNVNIPSGSTSWSNNTLQLIGSSLLYMKYWLCGSIARCDKYNVACQSSIWSSSTCQASKFWIAMMLSTAFVNIGLPKPVIEADCHIYLVAFSCLLYNEWVIQCTLHYVFTSVPIIQEVILSCTKYPEDVKQPLQIHHLQQWDEEDAILLAQQIGSR